MNSCFACTYSGCYYYIAEDEAALPSRRAGQVMLKKNIEKPAIKSYAEIRYPANLAVHLRSRMLAPPHIFGILFIQ
jgi:hypothetical protein